MKTTLATLGPVLCLFSLAGAGSATEGTQGANEFFEKQVRPLLIERCSACHGAAKAESNLRLDGPEGIRKGGARGPLLQPGSPEKSLLVQALTYTHLSVRMPPSGKLKDEEIRVLSEWVAQGAKMPPPRKAATAASNGTAAKKTATRHWAYLPVVRPKPPSVRNRGWLRTPVDAFVLRRLEEAGLRPAREADRRTWLRRVSFDLQGLPPTTSEIEAFLRDKLPGAHERVVERLLASPRYGERWARHWLDLVRYADTLGHEFDYEMFNAWRYRDYVIRAFNSDLPYNRFVREHIAGDLLPNPRMSAAEEINESVIGTGFWWLGEGKHSPVDVRQEELNRIDNQIDVFGKAFLGLTVACARCHDHKFDPIPSKDYYALAGYLKSSRYDQAIVNLAALRDPERLSQRQPALREAILADLAGTARAPEAGAAVSTALPIAHRQAEEEVFETFDGPDYGEWRATGAAFGQRPARIGEPLLGPRGTGLLGLAESGMASSASLSRAFEGALRSKTFTIRQPYLWIRSAGRGAYVNVVVDGFFILRDPIYGPCTLFLDDDNLAWRMMDLSLWQGSRAYIEILDSSVPNVSNPRNLKVGGDAPGDSYALVDEIRFSNSRTAPIDAIEPARASVQRLNADLKSGRLRLANSAEILRRYQEDGERIAAPIRVPALADGTGEDERVLLRGNYRTPGEPAPRKPLSLLKLPTAPAGAKGSDRLELAHAMTDPGNPLTARAIMNRVWMHHIGRAIAGTPDDLGVNGDRPTHPELLDWLAADLMSGGKGPFSGAPWSLKRMHRMIVLSATYRMSSEPVAAAAAKDPSNRLLHRMPVRRLDAECVRDSVLAVSGRLDATMFGPGVMPHLTDFMEGRGRPSVSGPLDGDGRRSVYLSVRRNFLSPMLLAFDFPIPFSTIGKRSVSNVPAQALTMMNSPFVREQAAIWAKRALSEPGATDRRIARLYVEAFGRPPTSAELADSKSFLEAQARRFPRGMEDTDAWAELCHVLYNVKEFVFVR